MLNRLHADRAPNAREEAASLESLALAPLVAERARIVKAKTLAAMRAETECATACRLRRLARKNLLDPIDRKSR